KVHILLPMCITIALGIGMLQRVGLAGAEAAVAEARYRARIIGLAFLGLPTAVFASPLIAVSVGAMGVEPFHLRTKVAALAVSILALPLILEGCRRAQQRLTFAMIFPVTATFGWYVGQRSGLVDTDFWPSPWAPHPSRAWLTLLVASALVSTAATVRRS